MRILIACEESGVVREAFTKLGHKAFSCDLLPSQIPGRHLQCDVRWVLDKWVSWKWDMMIAFPPCTHLCVSGARWFKGKKKEQKLSIEFFMRLANAPIPMIAIENPVGIMSTRWRKPDQIIQPWQFGHPESKRTCLWLRGLPKLEPTKVVAPTWIVCQGKRYSPTHYFPEKFGTRAICDNQTPSGQNKLGPSAIRAKIRSRTYTGIAEAMAEQWGG